MPAALLLDYAGSDPASRRSLLLRSSRALGNIITAILLTAVLTIRFALLGVGFTLVLIGTLLLTLGGRRGAARKIARWRDTATDHARLWSADIARGLRRWRDLLRSEGSQLPR